MNIGLAFPRRNAFCNVDRGRPPDGTISALCPASDWMKAINKRKQRLNIGEAGRFEASCNDDFHPFGLPFRQLISGSGEKNAFSIKAARFEQTKTKLVATDWPTLPRNVMVKWMVYRTGR